VQCSASFRIFSEIGLASAVGERLGLQATSAIERGQRLRPTTTAKAVTSVWELSTVERESELAEHLHELLSQIEPARDRLLSLIPEGYVMDWWCSVEALDTERAIELEPSLLARLAAFPAPLLIDAWTVFPDDE
jgi:hypothetical protein